MATDHSSAETPATQWLKRHQVPFTAHRYHYVDHGGAAHAATELGLASASVAKTLVMEDEAGRPLVVVMHGDREVSTKALARQIGVKRVVPCQPAVAQRHSGYLVGGTSPFATRKSMPVWVEETLLDLPTIYINGGRRGFLVAIAPAALLTPLGGRPVKAALADHDA